jgi:hypothetical protein
MDQARWASTSQAAAGCAILAGMPWAPELFSAPVLERIRSEARDARAAVPYFQGLMSGETHALVRSFAGEPELHHPVRGRVRGREAFERFVAETNAWLTAKHAVVENVERIIQPHRGVEEALITVDGDGGRVELPVAIAADRDGHARIVELRVYYSTWPLTGRHVNRPPVLQQDSGLHLTGIVGAYQTALAAGDAESLVGCFEPEASVREPAGGPFVHRGGDALRALFGTFFSNGGGIPLEHCAVTDDGRACAIEYNVVRWGRTDLPPQAGLAVYVRGDSGKLAAARIHDDVDPPL